MHINVFIYTHAYSCALAIYMCINDLKYFFNLRIQKESENIFDCDLGVCITHLD